MVIQDDDAVMSIMEKYNAGGDDDELIEEAMLLARIFTQKKSSGALKLMPVYAKYKNR